MRLYPFLTTLPLLASQAVQALQPLAVLDDETQVVTRDTSSYELEAMSEPFHQLYEYTMDFLKSIDNDSPLQKRDALEDTLTGVLTEVKNSQVIEKVLYEIAGSKQQIDNLSRYIYSLLSNMASGNAGGMNISLKLNTTEILNEVMASGLIQSIGDDLVVNDANRENLTTNVGDLLTQRPYIGKILNNLGAGQDLTFEMIFNTVRNFKSKAPELQDNQTSYQKRADDYSGSLNAFVNNIIGSALNGGFVTDSLGSILRAVKRSGIVTPIVITAVERPIMNMVGRLLSNLYDYGVLDMIPVNDYFQKGKKTHVLAHGLQDLLTSERYSPGVAKLFKQLEDQGTLENVRRSLYGP
ncbi:hypothetical protein FDK38_000289 [Candidozyma auris]|nr:hypothetical protein FDK38_000289 [[Candida] auris]